MFSSTSTSYSPTSWSPHCPFGWCRAAAGLPWDCTSVCVGSPDLQWEFKYCNLSWGATSGQIAPAIHQQPTNVPSSQRWPLCWGSEKIAKPVLEPPKPGGTSSHHGDDAWSQPPPLAHSCQCTKNTMRVKAQVAFDATAQVLGMSTYAPIITVSIWSGGTAYFSPERLL